jgi:hypothetical protein
MATGRGDIVTRAFRSTVDRRKWGLPPAARTLARDLVGAPRPAPVGLCSYCGGVAPRATVCEAHEDLTSLDAATSAVVTTSTQSKAASSQTLDGSTRELAAKGV